MDQTASTVTYCGLLLVSECLDPLKNVGYLTNKYHNYLTIRVSLVKHFYKTKIIL